MLFIVVSAVIVGICAAEFGRQEIIFDCSNAQGVVWWGCGSFGVCQGGQHQQIDCGNGTRYHRQAQQCTPREAAPYPCGNPDPDCRAFVDSPGHRVPDMQPDTFENRPPCSYYFTCSYGRFLGFQACPFEQVYDEGEQRCNLPLSVPPPCGFGPERDDARQGHGQGQGQGQGPNYGNQGPSYVTGNGPFSNQGQNYGSQGPQGQGSTTRPQGQQAQSGNYGNQAQPYGNPGQSGQGQIYGNQGQSGTYGNQGQSGNYGNPGQSGQRPTSQGQSQRYGNQGPTYGSQGQPGQGQTYSSQGQQGQGHSGSYGNQGSNAVDNSWYRFLYRY